MILRRHPCNGYRSILQGSTMAVSGVGVRGVCQNSDNGTSYNIYFADDGVCNKRM